MPTGEYVEYRLWEGHSMKAYRICNFGPSWVMVTIWDPDNPMDRSNELPLQASDCIDVEGKGILLRLGILSKPGAYAKGTYERL